MSIIKDISLSGSGHEKINWVKCYMPVLRSIEEEFRKTKPFAGKKIAMSIHLEAKTAYLLRFCEQAVLRFILPAAILFRRRMTWRRRCLPWMSMFLPFTGLMKIHTGRILRQHSPVIRMPSLTMEEILQNFSMENAVPMVIGSSAAVKKPQQASTDYGKEKPWEHWIIR